MIRINQPYHLVNRRPWALLGSLNAWYAATGLLISFINIEWYLFFTSLLILVFISYQW